MHGCMGCMGACMHGVSHACSAILTLLMTVLPPTLLCIVSVWPDEVSGSQSSEFEFQPLPATRNPRLGHQEEIPDDPECPLYVPALCSLPWQHRPHSIQSLQRREPQCGKPSVR